MKAINSYLIGKKVEEAGGTTLHMGSDNWILENHSGVFFKSPKEAGKLKLKRGFSEDIAELIMKIADELGEDATAQDVKEAVKVHKKKEEDRKRGEKAKIPTYRAILKTSTPAKQMRRPFSPIKLGEVEMLNKIPLKKEENGVLVDSGFVEESVKMEMTEVDLARSSTEARSSVDTEATTTTSLEWPSPQNCTVCQGGDSKFFSSSFMIIY